MNIFQQASNRKNKKLNIVFGSISIAILIAATYLTLSNHPIASRINVWQAGIMKEKDQYFPALTILLIALPLLIFLSAIKLIVLKMIAGKNEK